MEGKEETQRPNDKDGALLQMVTGQRSPEHADGLFVFGGGNLFNHNYISWSAEQETQLPLKLHNKQHHLVLAMKYNTGLSSFVTLDIILQNVYLFMAVWKGKP